MGLSNTTAAPKSPTWARSPAVAVRATATATKEQKMQIKQMPNTGAWQISAPVTNEQDTWVEIRTFYGIDEKEAVARYMNVIWSSGWRLV